MNMYIYIYKYMHKHNPSDFASPLIFSSLETFQTQRTTPWRAVTSQEGFQVEGYGLNK